MTFVSFSSATYSARVSELPLPDSASVSDEAAPAAGEMIRASGLPTIAPCTSGSWSAAWP